ncbi:MAG TPA: hypothetical protein VHC47_05135 [Mucilaginibacter sp.]|nr:hypothetical protein [Mucilaginibacter sp.]
MKPAVLLTCILLAHLNAWSQHIKESYLGFSLKGKVKALTEWNYEGNSANFKKDIIGSKFKIFYSKKGQSTALYAYDLSNHNKVIYSHTSTYDKKGRQVYLDSVGKPQTSYSDSYDSNRNLIENYYSGKYLAIRTFYNSKRIADSSYSYNYGGGFQNKTFFYYDKADDDIEESTYGPRGNFQGKETRKFDKRHNMIEEVSVDSNNRRYSKQTFKYDKNDNLLMRIDSNIIYYRGDGSQKLTSNKESSRKDVLVYTYLYYFFDKNHNWLQRNELRDGKIDRVTKREIEYFP